MVASIISASISVDYDHPGRATSPDSVRDAVLLPVQLAACDANLAASATRTGDGTLKVCVVNKDLERDVRIKIDSGQWFEHAALVRLEAPSVRSTNGVALCSSGVDDFGQRSPGHPQLLPRERNGFIEVPRASAAMVHFFK